MNIRAATLEDVDALTRLESELFGPDAWTRAQVVEELAGPGRICRVADEDGPVGYVVLRVGTDLVDLQRIGVRPERRREGIAAALLADPGSSAGRADPMLLEVSVANTGAIAFYAREGFVEIDRRRRYYRDGTDAVVMRREENR